LSTKLKEKLTVLVCFFLLSLAFGSREERECVLSAVEMQERKWEDYFILQIWNVTMRGILVTMVLFMPLFLKPDRTGWFNRMSRGRSI
jgi:hypothetical protein